MEHRIKIDVQYYEAVKAGKKNFEIRENDRGYNAGDTVILVPDDRDYVLKADIGYVCNYNQIQNYVVFSLLNIHEEYEL